MIVVDANIWIDHLRRADARLIELSADRQALIHPYTIGEIALGTLARREAALQQLDLLPGAPVARHVEVMRLIDAQRLGGTGIGYVDCHLLASTLLLAGGALWTRDRRLRGVAERLQIDAAFE